MPEIRSSTSFFLLFICLVIVAIPVVLFLPNLKTRPEPTPLLQVTDLLKNCAFFYQRCETSSRGVATNQSVDQLLIEIGSPLQQAPSLIHTSFNKPTSVRTQPAQILTLIASEYNINPFLLLTLSEMEDKTVTVADNLTQEVENGGEQQAWFSLKHQFIARELQEYATKDGLLPNSEDEKSPVKKIMVNNQEMILSGELSIASGTLIQYFAKHSTSPDELSTKITQFKETYQLLFGIDPSL